MKLIAGLLVSLLLATYRQYLDRAHASEYITAEEQARKAGKGLWKQNNPQPPWEFRRLLKLGC